MREGLALHEHLRTDPTAAAKLLSGSGPVAALWLTNPPDTPDSTLGNEDFVIACRLRMDQPVCSPGKRCQVCSQEGKMCNEDLDERGHHALTCSTGQGRYRPHQALLTALACIAREARLEAYREVTIPELEQRRQGRRWVPVERAATGVPGVTGSQASQPSAGSSGGATSVVRLRVCATSAVGSAAPREPRCARTLGRYRSSTWLCALRGHATSW